MLADKQMRAHTTLVGDNDDDDNSSKSGVNLHPVHVRDIHTHTYAQSRCPPIVTSDILSCTTEQRRLIAMCAQHHVCVCVYNPCVYR